MFSSMSMTFDAFMSRVVTTLNHIPDDMRIVILGIALILVGIALQEWTKISQFGFIWLQGSLLIWSVFQNTLFKNLLRKYDTNPISSDKSTKSDALLGGLQDFTHRE